MKVKFFLGSEPAHALDLSLLAYGVMVSVRRLVNRRSDFKVNKWIMDSGAFSQLMRDGKHLSLQEYSYNIRRWSRCGNLLAAVSQDYMSSHLYWIKRG